VNIKTRIRNRVSLGSLLQLVKRPRTIAYLPGYFSQLKRYRTLELARVGRISRLRLYPCLEDAKASQPVNGFYFYQDCWAARQVFREKPAYVVDVGSTVLLVGILSQFTPCISVDIRPMEAELAGLSTRAGSVLQLPFVDNEVPCLTTMCVLEHIGLGRYGDPLDPLGTEKAIDEIKRVIAPGGTAVYSVPIGQYRTEFNACRRFAYQHAASFFVDWDIVDSCILTPAPEQFVSEDALAALRDPVACFCMRKPIMNSRRSPE
jgi:hypothetical protein